MNIATIKYRLQIIRLTLSLSICLMMLAGCEDFLDTQDPTGQISRENVFEDEITATAAVTTLYAKLRDEVLVTGNSSGLGFLMGLYADELEYYGMPGEPFETFYNHQIIASDVLVSRLWNSSYNLIYMTNAAIEGLETSQNLSAPTKEQLIGEALFIRGLSHFYLTNLFGEIPYITTTNYSQNKQVSRMIGNEIYDHLISDLESAKALLGENYIGAERIRANKYAVSALLARVYLYSGEWVKAENESSLVINHTGLYSLPTLESEFLKSSPAAILQLKTKMEGFYTTEATTLVFAFGPPPFVALHESLLTAMEDDDQRRAHWIGEVTDGTNFWYYSNKYKQTPGAEYSVVFRLAEQYLIRAEARARQNNSSGAREDLNVIRNRAGLTDTSATTQEELLEAVLQERRIELLLEQGHRWFDVKRFNKADAVLAPIKPGWRPTNILLPIPETELLMNPNLNPQNNGY
jgi:hypothetical protein